MRRRASRATPPVALLGAGRVGTAMAVLLRRRGYPIVSIWSRSAASARRARRAIGAGRLVADPAAAARSARLVLVTPSDSAIAAVSEKVARGGGVESGTLVVHCSGALPASALGALRGRGVALGSIHPLQSFADVSEAILALPGSAVGCEGDPSAIPALFRIARDLGGKPFRLTAARKALYHAGAAAVSNYVVATAWLGQRLLRRAGLSAKRAHDASLPLLRGTLRNVERIGLPGALTGPIARGDRWTLETQLRAVERWAPREAEAFAAFAAVTVEVAKDKGTVSAARARSLLAVARRGDGRALRRAR